MHSVIVYDEELHKNAELVCKTCKELDEIVSEYCSLIHKISEKALVSGETANAFAMYVSYAEQLKGVLGAMAEHYVAVKDSFIGEIDRADDYLF